MEKDKDIIYIDTEDDITTVIGKVKASKYKIIALVPPKRTGILQSAVNLRLLQKAAKSGEKKIAIVTNNQALSSLAASAKIPVAKNLQSEPALAAVSALELDDGEDIIDGSDMPIENLVKVTDRSSDSAIKDDLKNLDIDNDKPKNMQADQVYAPKRDEDKKKNKVKVPNSAKFRKRLIIGIAGGVILIAFLVWAIIFAPAATVIIKAKTDSTPVNLSLSLANSTNTDNSTIRAITKTVTKSVTATITPTGTKEVGTSATGTLTLFNNGDSDSAVTISAGTTFTRSGRSFTTNNQVTVSGSTVKGGTIVPGQATVGITAAAVGSSYNLSSGEYNSPIANITATGSATNGGDSHTAKIVTDSDIATAKNSLDSQYKDSTKSSLKSQFDDDDVVINDSFSADYGSLTASPSVGSEVTSSASLSGTATYSLTGLSKSDLNTYLDNSIKSQMDTSKQQIYDNGVGNVSFSNYATSGSSASFSVSTTGQVGPKIDNDEIKQDVKGKNYGDAQSAVKSINGVSSVDVKFSFFWVNTVPNDTNKITVKFTVEK